MTAVDWIVDQMFKQGYFDGNKPLSITNLDHLQHQAKEMEKNSYICSKCKSQINGNEVMQQMQDSEKSD